MDGIATKAKTTIHLLNPQAGKGAAKKVNKNIKPDEFVYMPESPEASREFIKNTCKKAPTPSLQFTAVTVLFSVR